MKAASAQSLCVAVFAIGVLSGCGKQAPDALPEVASAAAVNATNPPAPATTANAAYAKLKGKWLRPDGGYVLEIRSVAPDGKIEAGYFNPNSIHVGKAEASQEGGNVKVFIELRDVNYPGSTYRLSYDPDNDRLAGTYYQAVARETYDVFFVRTKP